jgi:hypothetical protein
VILIAAQQYLIRILHSVHILQFVVSLMVQVELKLGP